MTDVPDYVRTCRWIGISLTPEQHRLFWFLESRGLHFCVHYGIHNALAKAHALWRQEGVQ
jgi:hypothetical protein